MYGYAGTRDSCTVQEDEYATYLNNTADVHLIFVLAFACKTSEVGECQLVYILQQSRTTSIQVRFYFMFFIRCNTGNNK